MDTPLPDAWLRGPLPGILAELQPVGHALIGALEDVDRATTDLSASTLWLQVGGAAPVGFHLLHLAGSTDRLFTYARGDALTEGQRSALASERTLGDPRATLAALRASWAETVEMALRQLAATPKTLLDEPRQVGRARLPSTVRGLLFHAAEHAQRHSGQVVTTAKIARAVDRP